MKKIYIEAKRNFDMEGVDFSLLDEFSGKTVSLAATIQYIDLLGPVKTYLEEMV